MNAGIAGLRRRRRCCHQALFPVLPVEHGEWYERWGAGQMLKRGDVGVNHQMIPKHMGRFIVELAACDHHRQTDVLDQLEEWLGGQAPAPHRPGGWLDLMD